MKTRFGLKRLTKLLRTYGISCCISYTLVSLILSQSVTLSDYGKKTGAEFIKQLNGQIFILCLVIAVLMLITDIVIDDGEDSGMTLLGFTLGLADVALPVLGLGGFVFNWFNVFSPEIISPIVILLIVYLVVFGMFFINTKLTEMSLNQKINERKESSNHEKNN